jgi:mannose-6-phosphate isomerase-like protein (cupin superfamily)
MMTIQIINTNSLIKTTAGIVHDMLYQSKGMTALMLSIEAGHGIDPCVMPMQVIYYVRSGNGSIFVGEEQSKITSGEIVVVDAGETRRIQAETDMSVLAFQFANTNPS